MCIINIEHKICGRTKQYILSIFITGVTFYGSYKISQFNEFNSILRLACFLMQFVIPIANFHLYHLWTKSYVRKVVYNSKLRTFEIEKFYSIFPIKRTKIVPDRSIMYTDDRSLHAKFINYIDLQDLETYFIAKPSAWVNMRLFSYLIKQNFQSKNLKIFLKYELLT